MSGLFDQNHPARALRVALCAGALLVFAACGTAADGPPPTPTSPLARYDAAIATAEVAGAAEAQAHAYYDRANVLLDRGEIEAALADYDRSIGLDPQNARAFNNRGLARATLGQADAALEDYSAAIRLDPSYQRAYENRLRLLEQRGDLATAAADYERLAALDPSNRGRYLYQRGSALLGLRDTAGARAAFDAALAADPQQSDALYERALLDFAEGRLEAAQTGLDAALRLSPRAANAHYARGLVRAARGDHAAALDDYSRALALRPDYPAALIGRATSHHALRDDARARADLDAAAKLPLDETLQAAVDALRREL